LTLAAVSDMQRSAKLHGCTTSDHLHINQIRVSPGLHPLCRQVTAICCAVRHAGLSRSIPAGYQIEKVIEHDRNPAARQASYPADEDDPHFAALE
jgi:hypothetical protein